MFQGVLVKEEDLENTTYRFTLDDGEVVKSRAMKKLSTTVKPHRRQLFDALKEGYYGKFYYCAELLNQEFHIKIAKPISDFAVSPVLRNPPPNSRKPPTWWLK